MNDFEEKITEEYVKNHALSLIREINKKTKDLTDEDNLDLIREREISNSAMHRFVYLALKEYHNALSQILRESNISLPDFDTLVADEPADQ